jgi:hypothetical protein
MITFLVLALAALAGFQSPMTTADTVRVDHLILGINDLEKGIAEFERLTGVKPVFGGRHPGRGTANALVSLGDGVYLELLGPSSKSPDSVPPMLAGRETLTPYGWALGTSDLPAVGEQLRARGISLSPIQSGSRRKPDNSMLTWRTAAAMGAGLEGAPFFIEWGAGTAHPSTTSPAGCRLVRLEARGPEPDPLRNMLEAVGIAIPVKQGSRALAFTLSCPRGEVSFN